MAAQGGDGALEIYGVPKNYGGDNQVQTASAISLVLKAAVAEVALAVEEDRQGESISGLAFVEANLELSAKPFTLFNASAQGEYAQASLKEILKTMDARLLSDSEITIPLLGKTLDASAISANPQFAALILSSIEKIASSF